MIKIEDLSVAFGETEAVRYVNLDLVEGEILGVVGESGSGKSVTALTLMGLAADTARVTTGRILFDGVTLREAGSPCDKRLYRSYQGARMSMVFQEPMTSEPYPEGRAAGGGDAAAPHRAGGCGEEGKGAGGFPGGRAAGA